jgi:hypothetical protein
MDDVARRFILSETADPQDSKQLVYATLRICGKLRDHLSRLLGHEGSCTLLSRSLKLASKTFPSLQSVKASPNGRCLEGLLESVQNQEPHVTLDTCAGVINSLIALFASFVGEDLATKLVEEAFSYASGGEDNPGDNHEP